MNLPPKKISDFASLILVMTLGKIIGMYILNKDLSLHYILNFIFTASALLIFTTLICLLYDKWKTRKASSVTPGGSHTSGTQINE